MNAPKDSAKLTDVAALAIVIIPLVLFFTVVGLGTLIDQKAMAERSDEEATPTEMAAAP